MIDIGDVCKYKNGNQCCFVITNKRLEQTGVGKYEFFFDGIYADGEVLHDGSLSLVELVEKKGGILLIEQLKKIFFVKDGTCKAETKDEFHISDHCVHCKYASVSYNYYGDRKHLISCDLHHVCAQYKRKEEE